MLQFCPMKDQSQCCPDNSQTIYEKVNIFNSVKNKNVSYKNKARFYDFFSGSFSKICSALHNFFLN